MSENELLAKLTELRTLPAETEWVEFKKNVANPKEFARDVGEYISALSNSAALERKPFGYIVWGVENETHRVVGTTFKPRKEKGEGNEDLGPWLAHSLTPRIDFTIHEFVTDGKPVVMFEIPAATSAPVRFKDTEFVRVGSYKKKLREYEGKERRLWALFSATGFEEGVAASGLTADEVIDLLGYDSFFTSMKQRLPENKSGILDRLAEERLVVRQPADRFGITNLGAILFARDLSRFRRLGRKAIRVIKYTGRGRLYPEKEWNDPTARSGYATGFDAMVAYINSQLPSNEHYGQAFRQDVRVYPEVAIRELTANLLIHQDYSVTGAGPMVEIFDDRIEFTNPGEPLVDPQRFIDMPPRSRNEELAAFMRRLDICEERGTGIDKVITEVEKHHLPPPDFRRPPGSTKVVLFGPRKFAEMSPEERIRACYQHCVLCEVGNTPMTNTSLRQRFGIPDKNYSIASRVIRDAVQAGVIRPLDPNTSKKYMSYVPVRPGVM